MQSRGARMPNILPKRFQFDYNVLTEEGSEKLEVKNEEIILFLKIRKMKKNRLR